MKFFSYKVSVARLIVISAVLLKSAAVFGAATSIQAGRSGDKWNPQQGQEHISDGINSEEFREFSPFFYAVLSQAAKKKDFSDAQALFKSIKSSGINDEGVRHAHLYDFKTVEDGSFGSINVILVKSDMAFHAAIALAVAGTTDVLAQACAEKTEFTVPKEIRNEIHKILKDWSRSHRLISVVGHSIGGTCASEVVHAHRTHYRNDQTVVVSFNAPGVITTGVLGPQQYHFATKSKLDAKEIGPKKNYFVIEDNRQYSENPDSSNADGMKDVYEGFGINRGVGGQRFARGWYRFIN